jgi:hypothetical protein
MNTNEILNRSDDIERDAKSTSVFVLSMSFVAFRSHCVSAVFPL